MAAQVRLISAWQKTIKDYWRDDLVTLITKHCCHLVINSWIRHMIMKVATHVTVSWWWMSTTLNDVCYHFSWWQYQCVLLALVRQQVGLVLKFNNNRNNNNIYFISPLKGAVWDVLRLSKNINLSCDGNAHVCEKHVITIRYFPAIGLPNICYITKIWGLVIFMFLYKRI